MPSTPESMAAYDALKSMDDDIKRSEANLRILKSMGSSSVLELENKLNASKRKRQEMMTAIEAEHNNAG